MIPTFVIFLREGIEASMIIAILMSYLAKVNKREHFRDVYLGVASAFVLILLGGIAAYYFISRYSGSNVQTYFETATYILAAIVLTGMTFWMSKHARTMSKELQQRSDVAISRGGRFALSALSFQAVGREGLETMVFTLAIIFTSQRQAGTPVHGNLVLVGGLLGLLVALAIAYAMYRLGTKINLKRFFRVLGVVLMLFAAGLVADAVQNLQRLNWLPVGRHVLWNTHAAITESSNIGDILHQLVGYAEQPTFLQVTSWAVYVVRAVSLFLRVGRVRPAKTN